jgi:hypothetical protein
MEWTARLAASLDAKRPDFPPVGGSVGRFAPGKGREVVNRRTASGLAVIGELASSGERVLVVCADALWRRGIVESAVHPGRYGGTQGAILAARGSLAAADTFKRQSTQRDGPSDGDAGVVLVDWAALSLLPDLPRGFEHVVVADPAPHQGLADLATGGDGYVHVLGAKRELSLGAVASALPDRKALAEAYRALDAVSGELDPVALRTALCGPTGTGKSPESCGLALRVLTEIGVVRVAGSGSAVRVEAVSSVRGDLSSSMSFRLIEKAKEECVRYLSQPEKPSSSSLEAAA